MENLIKDYLSQKNMTTTELALLANISEIDLRIIMKGYPTFLKQAVAIANAMNVTIEDIFPELPKRNKTRTQHSTECNQEFESVNLLKSYLKNATPQQLKEDWDAALNSFNH